MQRRLVPVAVALVAVAAFAVVAGSLDTVATDGPRLESSEGSLDDVDERAGASRAGASGPDGPDDASTDEFALRSLVSDALPTVPPPVLLAAATLGCGLLVLIARGGGGPADGADDGTDGPSEPPRSGDDRDPTTYPTGDPPADRPVLRAWRDTLGRIEADRPGGTTPAECAEIANERGWDADSVATLTTLFQRARYGGESDAEADRRATAAADRLRGER